MKKESKVYLEILISEINGILNDMIKENTSKEAVRKIGTLIDSWVVQNDLHPENVKSMSIKEFKKLMEK